MAFKLDEIIRNIIWGATAAIAVSVPIKGDNLLPLSAEKAVKEYTSLTTKKDNERSIFTLYKSSSRDIINNTFHRSHRSHSSHRSHYSSTTTTQQVAPPKQTITNPTEKNNAQGNQNNVLKQNQNNAEDNIGAKFGSRNLSKGMKGTDIADLQNLLIKKGYKSVKITAEFDDQTVEAVKAYQKTKKITQNGKLDALTLWYLQNDK